MTDIHVRRFTNHPQNYQGAILPADERWQLVLDAEGVPHLFLRVYVAPNEPGWLCLDDLLPHNEDTGEQLLVADLIDGVVEGELSGEEEEEAAYEEYMASPHICPT